MPKSDQERGPVSLWMRRERLARGWTTQDVVHQLAARGVVITEPSYRGYEAGPRVSVAVRTALEAVFGSPAPDTKKEAAEPHGLDDLIAAMYVQTAAITRLAAALEGRLLSEDERELSREEVEALRSVAAVDTERPKPTGGGARGVVARRDTARD